MNLPTLVPTNTSSAYAGTIDRSRLDDVIRLTRLAFREADGVLRGGDATAGTEITPRGITITPYLWPEGATIASDVPIDNAGVIAGAPLHLETAGIMRGPSTLFARDGGREVRLVNDGSAEIDTISATETVRNVDGGIEQAWRFEQAPEGTGDLTVRVAVAGLAYGTRTAGGLHFRDHATGLGFAYSDGTWIDATGSHHHVPATYADGEIVLTVPDHVVRASHFPAVLDPTVSTEREYDEPIMGPAVETQIEPDLAHSGNAGAELFIVWADKRRDTDQLHHSIFGATIDVSGVHAPTTGVVISLEEGPSPPADQRAPAVAWGFRDNPADGRYLVVWADLKTGQVKGRSMLADGAPDPNAPGILPPIGTGIEPDVAFADFTGGDANRFVVTWTNPTRTEILARRYSLDINDAPQAVAAQAILNAGTQMGSPAIASGHFGGGGVVFPRSDGFYIVWHKCGGALPCGNGLDVWGTSMNENGDAEWIGPGAVDATVAGAQRDPVVGFSGSAIPTNPQGFLLAWQDSNDIKARYLSTMGDFFNFPQAEIDVFVSGNAQTSPALAGSFLPNMAGFPVAPQWLVTWVEAGDIYGQRVWTGGTGVERQGSQIVISATVFSSLQFTPTASAYLDENLDYFVAWIDNRNVNWAQDIYGARVDNNGTVLDIPTPGNNGVLITESANQQDAPAIATCLGRYLTVWSDSRGGFLSPDIYGKITDAAGNVLFADIVIATATGAQRNPDVSCNRDTGDFFVVWEESSGQIYGRRVAGATGVPVGLGILIASGAIKKQPAVAFEGSLPGTYLVVFSDTVVSAFDKITGQRVNAATGALISGPITIAYVAAPSPLRHENPDVTYDEAFAPSLPAHKRFFVVWEMRGSGSAFTDIAGRFIQEDGAGLSALLNFTVSPSNSETRPSVATRPATSGVDRFHVLVFEQVLTTGVKRLWGQAITPAGSVTAGAALGFSGINCFEPAIANRTPDRFVLTFWLNESFISGTDQTFDFGVYGQDLAASSPTTLSLLSSFGISPSTNVRERTPSVACGTETVCEVPYRRYDDDPAFGVDRVRYRMLTY